MKTINKLRMMMMAVVAIVCGMTLSSCGDDDDDPAPKKAVDRVEMKVSFSMSQDLSDMVTANVICSNVQTDGAKTTTFRLNDGMDSQTLLTATKFPAKFTLTTNAFKKRELKIKNTYEIAYSWEVMFITYYTDGTHEVTPVRPDTKLAYESSETLDFKDKTPSEEDVKQIADTYQKVINGLLDGTFSLTVDGTKVTITKG